MKFKKSRVSSEEKRKIEHAKKRAWQRLRIHLSRKDLRTITEMIRSGDKATFQKNLCRDSELWRVPWGNRELPVVYDTKKKCIDTFYNEEDIEKEANS